MALEAGYADQSHLVNGCRGLAGVPPTLLAAWPIPQDGRVRGAMMAAAPRRGGRMSERATLGWAIAYVPEVERAWITSAPSA